MMAQANVPTSVEEQWNVYEGFFHVMLHMWVASWEILTGFLKNNAIVNLQGWLLKLEPLLCNKERQQKILMNDNHISEFKSVVPKLMNAVIVSCVKLVKISQHDRFENPWNLPVWSLPVKAWNPSNALHTRGVNLSKIWHRL